MRRGRIARREDEVSGTTVAVHFVDGKVLWKGLEWKAGGEGGQDFGKARALQVLG